MSQNEQNLEDELKLKPANIQELQFKLELAKIELETKKLKLEPETLKMLYEENSRVREHEVKMAELKIEEKKAQFEIEKQRLEERQLVTKEFEEKQAKQNGGVDFKSIGIAISAVAVLINNYFGNFGTAAASQLAAGVAAVTPMVKEVISNS